MTLAIALIAQLATCVLALIVADIRRAHRRQPLFHTSREDAEWLRAALRGGGDLSHRRSSSK